MPPRSRSRRIACSRRKLWKKTANFARLGGPFFIRLIDNEDGDEAEQRTRSAMRGFLLIVVGRLIERHGAFIDQSRIPRSWVTGDPLDPCNAVTITVRKLFQSADRPMEPEIMPEADEGIQVPRIPIHVAEARAMMAMLMLMLADGGSMYAGYFNDELELLPGGGAQIHTVLDPHTGQETVEVRTGSSATPEGADVG